MDTPQAFIERYFAAYLKYCRELNPFIEHDVSAQQKLIKLIQNTIN